MQPGKSPGTDGLLVEFYKVFWNDISFYYVKSINNAYQRDAFSELRGIASLISKKDIILYHLENQRPITVLN